MTKYAKYGNMLESNQSLKLLKLLLLCQPCRYEYYPIIDYRHILLLFFFFSCITFYFDDGYIVVKFFIEYFCKFYLKCSGYLDSKYDFFKRF